jgi:hypothetical protein
MNYPICSHMPARRVAPPDVTEITMTSTGAAFAPRVYLAEPAEVTIAWSDGTENLSLAAGAHNLSRTFGSTQDRVHVFTIEPATALVVLNLGYQGEDGGEERSLGGDYDLDFYAYQGVRALSGLTTAPNLEHLAFNETDITSIDCTGLSRLRRIEAYGTNTLTSVTLFGCTGLRRSCFETCPIPVLDFRSAAAIEDIRNAFGGLQDLYIGNTSALWHICIRVNYGLNEYRDFSTYTALEELWTHECQWQGAMVLRSPVLESVWLQQNHLTSFDSGTSPNFTQCLLHDNEITTVTLSGSPVISEITLQNNLLSQAQVDAVLVHLAGGAVSNGTCNIGGTGNAAPSATGSAAVATLQARGWTVTTN